MKVLESIPKRKSFFHSGMLSLFLERQDTRLKSRELTRKKFSCSILCSSKIFILGKYFQMNDRVTRVDALPMGINYDLYHNVIADDKVHHTIHS